MDGQILGIGSVMAGSPDLHVFEDFPLSVCLTALSSLVHLLTFVLMTVEQELLLETFVAIINLTNKMLSHK